MVEALKQLVMDCQLSCKSALPWIWAIETLALSNQVDISLLLDLLEKTPEVSDCIGRNARELVSLRILENFFVQGARANPVASASSGKIGLDPSDRCEDVLRRILTETSPSRLKPSGLETSKWDLQHFIVQKRSSLDKYALRQLKDAILMGSHPFLASLKEQSGVLIGNQPGHEAPVGDGNCNSITPRLEGSDANNSHLLHGDFPDENLVPADRKRRSTSENAGGKSCENRTFKKHKAEVCSESFCGLKRTNGDMDTFEPNIKKNMLNVSEVEEAVNISSDDGNSDDTTDITTKNNSSFHHKCANSLEATNWRDQDALADTLKGFTEEVRSLGIKAHVEVMRQKGPPADGNNECTSPKGLVGHDEVLPHEEQAPHCGAEVLDDKFDGERNLDREVESAEGDKIGFQGLTTNEDMEKFEQNVPRNVPNVGDSEEDANIYSDSDGFHDEEASIDTKKKMFLSSQCTYSQDSLATSDWRELNLCMKCSKGGKLLVCSSNSCPLVIHESCLGSDASYDTMGNFYCPFCAYSQAISKFTEIKKKASLARMDLATFICLGTQKGSKKQSHRSYRIKHNHWEQDDSHKHNKLKTDVAKGASTCQQRRALENEQAGPSELCSGLSLPFGEKAMDSTSRIARNLNKDKQERRRMRQVSQAVRVNGEHQTAELAIRKSQDETKSCQVSERSDGCKNHTGTRSKKGVFYPRETKEFSSNSRSSDAEETSAEEDENETSGASKYFTRVRKQERQYSHQAIPQLRRRRLLWTSAEEDALKEGMRLLSSPKDKIMPWKKILEFGAGIFQKNRTTIDLKDKWRNMCKATPKF